MTNPKYRQIADSLREEIDAGVLKAGTQLSTEIELSGQWRASRSTVREAIKLLTELGLVEARPGQGTFVQAKIVPFVTDLSADPAKFGERDGDLYSQSVKAQHRVPDSTTPRVETHLAVGEVATELELPARSLVLSRHQQRFIDGQPYSLQTSFFSMNLVTVRGADRLIVAEDIREGSTQYLRDALGVKEAGYRYLITVRTPDRIETTFFRLPEDGRVGVFENLRTSYDQDGNPFRLTVTVCPGDRNEFVMNGPDSDIPDEPH